MDQKNIDFKQIKFRAEGMLDPGVYRKIAQYASRSRADIVEIGTYKGAATVSMALAADDNVTVHTVDRFELKEFGDPLKQSRKITERFVEFGVSGKVALHVGTPADFAAKLDVDKRFGMCMLDADGAIDRDFRLFYDRLEDGAPIVIDDYARDKVNVMYLGGSEALFMQKHRLTFFLVDFFEEKGIIRRDEVLKDTYFGFKSSNRPFAELVSSEELLAIYLKLVNVRAKLPIRIVDRTKRVLQRDYPKLYMALKRATGKAVD